MTADESPRLYSRPSIVPVDTVAPQHLLIHADLERWGRWNTERIRPRSCASKERDFDGRAGYRSNHYPTLPVSLPENARNRQIERAVVRMPMQHRTPHHFLGACDARVQARADLGGDGFGEPRDIGGGAGQHAARHRPAGLRVVDLAPEECVRGNGLDRACAHGAGAGGCRQIREPGIEFG